MTGDDKLQTALAMLAERVMDARYVMRITPSYDEVNRVGYWNRASRWRDTTIALLESHVSPAEAVKFSKVGYGVPGGSPDSDATRRWLARQTPFLEILAEELKRHPEAILPGSLPVHQSDVRLTREGIFLRGQTFDALRLVRGLIQDALNSIQLIDNYLSEDTINIVEPPAVTVSIRILTAPVPHGKPRKPIITTAAKRMKEQYSSFEIREGTDFHDRFLIIDETNYYHFGASIKDLGKGAFMFSRIEEGSVQRAIESIWNNTWTSATVLI